MSTFVVYHFFVVLLMLSVIIVIIDNSRRTTKKLYITKVDRREAKTIYLVVPLTLPCCSFGSPAVCCSLSNQVLLYLSLIKTTLIINESRVCQ
jgi:hypothetical protein